MTVSKADLLKKRFGVEEYEIPGVGSVSIRALSRAEALRVTGKEMEIAEMERKLLAMAVVDPQLTEDDVLVWQEASPAGEMEPLVDAVLRLSGMKTDSAKEAVKNFRS